MSIVNSNPRTNLFTLPVAAATSRVEGQLLALSPAQLVRATVVEVGLDRTVLEIGRQNYLAQSERELQVGQKLELQVLQTQPRLEVKVLNNFLNDKLSQTLPLLTRPFDWSQLVGQLRQYPEFGSPPLTTNPVYQQLQQLLGSATGTAVTLKGDIALIVAQLQQLAAGSGINTDKGMALPVAFMSAPGQPVIPGELSPVVTQLIKNLQNQLLHLPRHSGSLAAKNWYVETRNLLVPLQSGRPLPPLPAPQYHALRAVLGQFRQSPLISPQLLGEVERIMVQMERGLVQDLAPGGVAVGQKTAAIQNLPSAKVSATVADEPLRQQLSAEIKQLLGQLQPEAGQKQKIAPELLGKLEGLLVRLQQLPTASGKNTVAIPELATLVAQLNQVVEQQPSVPQGGKLGVLSQLFGFYLETELLRGKKKAALASLKLSLLNLQKEMGREVEEPLRRLELFQLCKAKLADEQVQFLPLPFNELEEGYLLAERNGDVNDEDNAPLQLSLSLRLSALGNIRIDMLYDGDGLHLRLAAEGEEKMKYLQVCSPELKQSLQAVTLRGVSFSADAQPPTRQLQQRLLPESISMLDTRI